MKKDPDIVTILRKEEKLGFLKISKNKKFQDRIQNDNNLKNTSPNKKNITCNDYYINGDQSPDDKKIFSEKCLHG